MICVNELTQLKAHQYEILSPLTILLAPFAPHITAELWLALGNKTDLTSVPFPVYNEKFLIEEEKEYPVSFNGKMRFVLSLSLTLSREAIQEAVMNDERTATYLKGATPKKIIVVPQKIINVVF